ncbi:hypothetical protein B296_00038127 [Ensete ventricosum]|uniref:Uncharacterized protein n=1 Tax=Ensete ventricosum TaxID=4639 RepID=A0A426Z564_ENSVE|nr:hypothetical protein B296_00038127 [Ensete ventricosum]
MDNVFSIDFYLDTCQGICVKMIAAGAEHTAAVTEDGDFYGWGWGRYGNLGLGDRNDRLTPEKVTSIKVQLLRFCSSMKESMCSTACQEFGQLGVGDNDDHCSPVQVKLPEEQAAAKPSTSSGGNGNDTSVPDNNNDDVKRMRV